MSLGLSFPCYMLPFRSLCWPWHVLEYHSGYNDRYSLLLRRRLSLCLAVTMSAKLNPIRSRTTHALEIHLARPSHVHTRRQIGGSNHEVGDMLRKRVGH